MDLQSWPFNLWEDAQGGNFPYSFKYVVPDIEARPCALYLPNFEEVFSSVLDERQQKMMRMRYEQGMTYEAIGNEFNLSRERIRRIVAESLLKLREPKNYYRLNAIPEVDVIRLKSQLKDMTEQNENLKKQMAALTGELDKKTVEKQVLMPLDSDVSELNISLRSYHALILNNITTVGQLISCSASHLLGMRSLGKVALADIERALGEYGYKLN